MAGTCQHAHHAHATRAVRRCGGAAVRRCGGELRRACVRRASEDCEAKHRCAAVQLAVHVTHQLVEVKPPHLASGWGRG